MNSISILSLINSFKVILYRVFMKKNATFVLLATKVAKITSPLITRNGKRHSSHELSTLVWLQIESIFRYLNKV